MKKILFIGGTHGDEPIGVNTLKNLSTVRSDFDWIIGNPLALAQEKRYTGADLNRSAPGDSNSPMYEKRRAAEILTLAKQYDITVDLHGTVQNTGIFIIITNPTKENLRLASLLDIDRIVLWPSVTPEMKSPMSEFFPCGLEIESGPKKSDLELQNQLSSILSNFLDKLVIVPTQTWQENLKQKTVYQMVGHQTRSADLDIASLQEFGEVTYNDETFTTVFIGTYDYSDIVCYKLKKLNIKQIEKYYS